MKQLMWMQVHQRLEIVEQVLRHHDDIDCLKFAVCSTQQESELLSDYGWYSYIHRNKPLGKKSDYGIRAALNLDWTHLIQINSDDFLAADYWPRVEKLISKGVHFAGIKDIYFVCSETWRVKRVVYGAKDRDKMFLGAGRMISRQAIEETMAGTGCLFDWHINRALDYHSEKRLISTGYVPVEVKSPLPLVMDLKSKVNIWSFNAYQPDRLKMIETTFDEMQKQIGYEKPE